MTEHELRILDSFLESLEPLMEDMAIDDTLTERMEQDFFEARAVVQEYIRGLK